MCRRLKIENPELCLTKDLSIHFIELPRLEEKKYDHKNANDLEKWCHFFNHAIEEGNKKMQEEYNNPTIQKAFRALEYMSQDPETRHQAFVRERALHDEATLLYEAKKQGIEQGIEQGKTQDALKFLSMGVLTHEQIAFGTGLSVSKVEELAKTIK